jgi:hypothetical protein
MLWPWRCRRPQPLGGQCDGGAGVRDGALQGWHFVEKGPRGMLWPRRRGKFEVALRLVRLGVHVRPKRSRHGRFCGRRPLDTKTEWNSGPEVEGARNVLVDELQRRQHRGAKRDGPRRQVRESDCSLQGRNALV